MVSKKQICDPMDSLLQEVRSILIFASDGTGTVDMFWNALARCGAVPEVLILPTSEVEAASVPLEVMVEEPGQGGFICRISVLGSLLALGRGRSKKLARQRALARAAARAFAPPSEGVTAPLLLHFGPPVSGRSLQELYLWLPVWGDARNLAVLKASAESVGFAVDIIVEPVALAGARNGHVCTVFVEGSAVADVRGWGRLEVQAGEEALQQLGKRLPLLAVTWNQVSPSMVLDKAPFLLLAGQLVAAREQWRVPEDGRGGDMLQRLGWRPGKGLGKVPWARWVLYLVLTGTSLVLSVAYWYFTSNY